MSGGCLNTFPGESGEEGLSFGLPTPTTGWPTYRVDAANTGFGSEKQGPVTAASERWTFETGGPVRSAPAVVPDDGGGETLFVGSTDGTLSALDTDDGSLRWQLPTDDGIDSGPAVASVGRFDGRTVFVGSWDGTVLAVDANDGSVRWTYEMTDGTQSSPTVVTESGEPSLYIGDWSGRLYCLDATDGTERWTADTGDSIQSTPAISDVSTGDSSDASDGSTVYVGSNDASVYAFDATDGTEQWRYGTPNRVASSPAVASQTVFVGGWEGTVYALDATDGSERWTYETGDSILRSPALVGREDGSATLYVGSWTDTVHAIDAARGGGQWRFETELHGGGGVVCPPVVAGETVLVASFDQGVFGRLYGIDARSGQQRWELSLGQGVFTSPAVTGGTMYLGSSDSNVYAVAESPAE